MFKNLSVPICFLLLASCTNSDKKLDCSKFKTGKFFVHTAEIYRIDIDRSDSVQIDTYKTTGDISKSNIKWVSDCENELTNTFFKTRYYSSDSMPTLLNKTLKTKIISFGSNYCVFEYSVSGDNEVNQDTLFIAATK